MAKTPRRSVNTVDAAEVSSVPVPGPPVHKFAPQAS
jgi:hypothetical protein